MSENEPSRLLEDEATDALLRDALHAARDDLPTDRELASLAARLGPLLVPPGGGGGGGAPAAPAAGSIAGKVIGLAAAPALTVGGAVWWGSTDAPERPPAPRVARDEAPPPPPAPPIPEGVDVPSEPIEADVEAPARRRPAPRYEVDVEAELALIRSAQDELTTWPARALAFTDQHRRRFGEGTLAQEREVVAIDALVRLGRGADARARADAFRARWPRSAHLRRIDVLVPPSAAD